MGRHIESSLADAVTSLQPAAEVPLLTLAKNSLKYASILISNEWNIKPTSKQVNAIKYKSALNGWADNAGYRHPHHSNAGLHSRPPGSAVGDIHMALVGVTSSI